METLTIRSVALVLATFLTLAPGAFAQQAVSITDSATQHKRAHATSWQWREAPVDLSNEYLELYYGSADEADWDDWTPIARVGPPVNGVFPVEFLSGQPQAQEEALVAAREQLDYYLVQLGKPDPWGYAVYHTMTLANVYSRVHWALISPAKQAGE